MKHNTNYTLSNRSNHTYLLPIQTSLFPQQKKQAKKKQPPQPINLTEVIPFGKYNGIHINSLLHKPEVINWYAKAVKRPLHYTVTQAINNNQYLAQ
jgi:hypothetical protein